MGRRSVVLGIWTAVSLAAASARAESLRLTLDEAVTRVRSANLASLASRKDVDVARAAVQRSDAWLPSNPYVSFGASHRPETGGRPNIFGLLSQEFEVAGQRGLRRESARRSLDSEESSARQEELTLVAGVKTAFARALINQDRLRIARQNSDLATELTHHRGPDGSGSGEHQVELNSARIRKVRAERDAATAAQALDDSLDELRRMLDLPFDTELNPVGKVETRSAALPPLALLVQRARDNRPDLRAFQQAAKASDAHLNTVRREKIPNVTLTGSYSRFDTSNYYGGDVGLSLPVTGAKDGDIAEAVAERERADLELRDRQREIEREVREAWRTCDNAARDFAAFRDTIVPLHEENVQIRKRQLERDKIEAADLVAEQIELLDARSEHLDALEKFTTALYELERAAGGSLEEAPNAPPAVRPGK